VRAQQWDHPEYSDDELAAADDDPAKDAAKDRIRTWFRENPGRVLYQQQLSVLLEDDFFHWVSRRAAEELVAEGRLVVEAVAPAGGGGGKPLRIYRMRSHRNWLRQAKAIAELVRQFSPGMPLGDSLGPHGEMMVDAAMAGIGFVVAGRNVSSWNEQSWGETGHDLDRVYVKDGVAYGAEIKNTLKYIPLQEFNTKLKMCQQLKLRPLFITRFSAKTYNYAVYKAGGFALLFKWQLYPFGFAATASEVSKELGLPVKCPARIEDGTMQRLLNWHAKNKPA
jgi:hypothetical protein